MKFGVFVRESETNKQERNDPNSLKREEQSNLLEEKTNEEGKSEKEELIAAMLHVDVNQKNLTRKPAHKHPIETRSMSQR